LRCAEAPAFLEVTAPFGRPVENSFGFFVFLTLNSALRAIENPRVDGSIPALATTPNFMISLGFRASPADHPWPIDG
jgi:hypothetical protein